MTARLEPGAIVRLSGREDWGLGQVQSIIKGRITVNFEHAGKQTLEASRVTLELVQAEPE